MTRNKLLLAMVAVSAAAHPARAQSCAGRAIEEVVAACDSAFEGGGLIFMSARGWCYMINGARCALP
jgi:hypothetical protein